MAWGVQDTEAGGVLGKEGRKWGTAEGGRPGEMGAGYLNHRSPSETARDICAALAVSLTCGAYERGLWFGPSVSGCTGASLGGFLVKEARSDSKRWENFGRELRELWRQLWRQRGRGLGG